MSSLKQSLQKHLNRKRICQPIMSNTEPSELLLELYRMDPAQEHKCTKCNKCFSHISSRYRHEKHCMKLTETKLEELEHELARVRKQLETIQDKPSTVNNVHINNTVFNTQINALGKENTSHLTHSFLNRCVRRTNQGIIDLLEKLHFDPNLKENANIRASSSKVPKSLLEYNDGERWRFERKDRVLNQMLDKGQDILQEHLDDHAEEIRNECSESMFRFIVEFFNRVSDKDKRTLEELITDIYILILNRREIVSPAERTSDLSERI